MKIPPKKSSNAFICNYTVISLPVRTIDILLYSLHLTKDKSPFAVYLAGKVPGTASPSALWTEAYGSLSTLFLYRLP